MMSKELAKSYNPKDFEDRIYKYWNDSGCFKAEIDENKKPYTIVIPPPNITGQLHMGHALDETLQDILIRYKRMSGILLRCGCRVLTMLQLQLRLKL